ncbi:MAG: AbrB/MazE/SpoVT family DNA-binding domain-containing protein [Candidatus Hydrogenedentes bacterium]|nr:AbrB/MazE/SpoVT family DNA-binding domain-containing protein [Candidatus Hydrogenedentota bacterium]
MRVTKKGQVTIPFDLREKTGIVPGNEVKLSEEEGRIVIRKVAGSGRGKDVVGRMTGKGSVRMSTDEVMALTRGDTT